MSSTPLVSIVCTAYQHEKFIKEALDGFLMQQTDFPYEVIVHDDASLDATTAIIRDYAERFPDIIRPIFQTVNQFSREPGLVTRIVHAATKGKYVALCEGDDYWTDPNKLQKQVDLMEADPSVSGCFHYVQQTFEGTENVGQVFGEHGARLRFKAEDTFSLLALFHPASLMFRRTALTLPKWLGRIKSGDMAFYALIANEGDLVCIPEVMAVYRKHAGGITSTALHNGSEYHLHRILLWLLLDQQFDQRHTLRCEALFKEHWKHIVQQTTPRVRVRYLLRLMREVPGWFLRKPVFSLRRFKEALVG